MSVAGVPKIDFDATAAAGFADSSSHVLQDGREVLRGKDMGLRREEVWKRDRGRCVRCQSDVSPVRMHMHHRIRRSHRRDDRLTNVECLCATCHMREHNQLRSA